MYTVLAQEEAAQLTYPHVKEFLEYLQSQLEVRMGMTTVCMYKIEQESLANARHLKWIIAGHLRLSLPVSIDDCCSGWLSL